MILLFCMQRPDVFSYDDLAIQRGLRMVYHHRKIDRKLFEKYRRRFSPYCSVASLYLWAAAGRHGAGVEGLCPQKESPGQKGSTRWFPHRRKHKSTTEGVDAMMFTAHYQSPLGEILLAADEVGLTGLWFDRAKYYAAGLAPQEHRAPKTRLDRSKVLAGCVFQRKNAGFYAAAAPRSGQTSGRKCGRCCCKSHTGKRQHTARWPPGLRQSMARRACPPRRWAEPWDITPFRSSSRATVWWVPAAA